MLSDELVQLLNANIQLARRLLEEESPLFEVGAVIADKHLSILEEPLSKESDSEVWASIVSAFVEGVLLSNQIMAKRPDLVEVPPASGFLN